MGIWRSQIAECAVGWKCRREPDKIVLGQSFDNLLYMHGDDRRRIGRPGLSFTALRNSATGTPYATLVAPVLAPVYRSSGSASVDCRLPLNKYLLKKERTVDLPALFEPMKKLKSLEKAPFSVFLDQCHGKTVVRVHVRRRPLANTPFSVQKWSVSNNQICKQTCKHYSVNQRRFWYQMTTLRN